MRITLEYTNFVIIYANGFVVVTSKHHLSDVFLSAISHSLRADVSAESELVGNVVHSLRATTERDQNSLGMLCTFFIVRSSGPKEPGRSSSTVVST